VKEAHPFNLMVMSFTLICSETSMYIKILSASFNQSINFFAGKVPAKSRSLI
jgi:hypothetical protein